MMTDHFLFQFPQFVNERRTVLRTRINNDHELLNNSNIVLVQTLIFGKHHIIQMKTLRFLLLELILYYWPKDLIYHFLNNDRLYPLIHCISFYFSNRRTFSDLS